MLNDRRAAAHGRKTGKKWVSNPAGKGILIIKDLDVKVTSFSFLIRQRHDHMIFDEFEFFVLYLHFTRWYKMFNGVSA